MARPRPPSNSQPDARISCLHSFCWCRCARVSHFVAVDFQYGEGGVCLVIFHTTHSGAQVAACVLSHTTAPVRSTCCLQGNACEDARNVCATARPVRCAKTCPLSLRKNMKPKPCLERHPKHEMSRYKHVRKLVSKLWHHLDCFEIVQLS